eukprot:CAMPEP_0119010656 /NCGR_PEP_ID=MMETSP1176-20130426/5154_1 /TAXON_ID=265551 /ORGANISM="Synedropsis recta cf, Strain CCMP1620" /LENGTH=814 /DNA_ID=CAMNT_0006963361 /DNA_START=160 /DNA_END=2604 /DNA_ORIENTATION=-
MVAKGTIVEFQQGDIESGGEHLGSGNSIVGSPLSTWATPVIILILGLATSGAFLGVGISSAVEEQNNQFTRSANDLILKINGAWGDYVYAASMIHNRCRSRNFTRSDFRDLYEYLTAGGLDFQAAQFDPNITHEERPDAEAEALAFYEANYPTVDYRGFVGFNYDNSTSLDPRNNASHYFPIHYMEPVVGNERAIDLDYHASGSRKKTVLYCMDEGSPALTDRLRLVQETAAVAYGVVLMHPGVQLSSKQDVWPRDLASIVIRIPDLLKRSAENQAEPSKVYLYDRSDSSGSPLFLGAIQIDPVGGEQAILTPLEEVELEEVLKADRMVTEEIPVASKVWVVVVTAVEGTFQADLVFVILGGVIICIASLCLALWVWTNTCRMVRFNAERARSDAEKSALILDNAKQSAKAERELNDFVAHEVRNPVAAAMAACSFVKTAVNKAEPLQTEESRSTTRDDVSTIENALRFVNDLLRNMLDMHRSTNKQLKVNNAPTYVRHDVLDSVKGMLYQRDGAMEVSVHCPENLVVMSDRLRLKQIMMNLGRNSAKFLIEGRGFIKLSAEVVDGNVQLSVADSGPGIPQDKRAKLFNKYQESLDLLSQGTGIGLFLCKSLMENLGGTISLDESYDSGVPGFPGARFVIDLCVPSIEGDAESLSLVHEINNGGNDSQHFDEDNALIFAGKELPENLSVLFVDDDPILRKLFSRMVIKAAPSWEIRQASNGEAALFLADMEDANYDLIFVDMYMASVEAQMLGTETVEALRAKGVMCRICGLSANDKEKEFMEAGADSFTFKPLPCETRALTRELCRILYQDTP